MFALSISGQLYCTSAVIHSGVNHGYAEGSPGQVVQQWATTNVPWRTWKDSDIAIQLSCRR